jgi:hypothetical protein
MFGWAITFLMIALIAAALGFVGSPELQSWPRSSYSS